MKIGLIYFISFLFISSCAGQTEVISICSFRDSRAFELTTFNCDRCEIYLIDTIPILCMPKGKTPEIIDSFNIYPKLCPPTCLDKANLKKLDSIIQSGALGILKKESPNSRNTIIITAYDKNNELLYVRYIDANEETKFYSFYYLINPVFENDNTFKFYIEETISFFEYE